MPDQPPITDFARLLALEERAPDRFAATPPGGAGHLFGGTTFGLAARAAALTVPDGRPMHAASCQYLAAGRGGTELAIGVERVRDGRRLSVRRVTVSGDGRTILTCDAWFAPAEGDDDWQPPAPPDDRGDATVPVAPLRVLGVDPLEIWSLRPKEHISGLRTHPYWARSRRGLGEDRALNLGAIAFLSDMSTTGLIVDPTKGGAAEAEHVTTLNHTLWVHRPFTLDDWLRVDGSVVSIHGNRGLATGQMHREDGTLVASFSQESIRARRS